MRPSNHDRIIGDGGRVTVYQRPNGPWYALDRRARKCELPSGRASSGRRSSTPAATTTRRTVDEHPLRLHRQHL